MLQMYLKEKKLDLNISNYYRATLDVRVQRVNKVKRKKEREDYVTRRGKSKRSPFPKKGRSAITRESDPKIGSGEYNLNRCSFEGSIDRTERAERPGPARR